jgi:hypothetical protein
MLSSITAILPPSAKPVSCDGSSSIGARAARAFRHGCHIRSVLAVYLYDKA